MIFPGMDPYLEVPFLWTDPLAPGDDATVVDLQAVLERTYELSGYQGVVRYDQLCVQAWASGLIQEKWRPASSSQ
jgi:hypothetical protein